MKECIICKQQKDMSEFYKHPEMTDGYLNKCKECCKEQSKHREDRLRVNPEFVEKEKTRAREKYYRLGYKDKHKPSPEKKKIAEHKYRAKYPEKAAAARAIGRLERKEGFELHHWSYNEEHFKDVIELPKKEHYLIHRHMIYDTDIKMYRNSSGIILGTKQSHVDLLEHLLSMV